MGYATSTLSADITSVVFLDLECKPGIVCLFHPGFWLNAVRGNAYSLPFRYGKFDQFTQRDSDQTLVVC